MLTEVRIMMVGKKIKYYRLKKGLTTKQLAKDAGCPEEDILLYESEARDPSKETCKNIAAALGVPWVALISRSNNNLVFDHINISFRKKL